MCLDLTSFSRKLCNPLPSCWYWADPKFSLLCPPHIHPLGEPSFTFFKYTAVLPEAGAPLDMSPQVCKGQLWRKVTGSLAGRVFSQPSLSQGSAGFFQLMLEGTSHPLLCEPHPPLPLLLYLISPLPSTPHKILCWLTYQPGMRTRESIQKIDWLFLSRTALSSLSQGCCLWRFCVTPG